MEFSLKVVGSNPGYLLNPFLLYSFWFSQMLKTEKKMSFLPNSWEILAKKNCRFVIGKFVKTCRELVFKWAWCQLFFQSFCSRWPNLYVIYWAKTRKISRSKVSQQIWRSDGITTLRMCKPWKTWFTQFLDLSFSTPMAN